ncbi:single-stranded DNA-binding protein [Cylindrospermopsis curvispora]|uniref:Single-stranded DNA-binding protein n=1 Tax=Cylindrospermopsis curvispora GIHE-G1 TaxID=2666332 RepID=A0A7H0F156_9CYAN|nr:single-stranded DNA-binding protein [Cylindrospermopsis curvispora]QNP29772.1 single-stranded DNA-binding protein [Cylindrospermopsis curvispora GIHE-G1]
MNSCILMVEIYDQPQLRHTTEGLEVTEMIVHVPGLRADDPTHPLKVVGWGNLAKDIHQNYHAGDRVILEGRLGMNTFERPEGFKEKRAELTVQKIHPVTKNIEPSQSGEPRFQETANYQASRPTPTPTVADTAPLVTNLSSSSQPVSPQPVIQPAPNPDEIPF